MEKFVAPNPDFKSRVLHKIEGNAFMHYLGLKVTAVEAGFVGAELALQPQHFQQFGRLHGGVVTALADIVAGFSVYTLAPAHLDVVTGEIKISYLRPGTGDTIIAEGRVLKPGKTISFAEAEIFALREGQRLLIAKASTTMVLINLAQ